MLTLLKFADDFQPTYEDNSFSFSDLIPRLIFMQVDCTSPAVDQVRRLDCILDREENSLDWALQSARGTT